MPSGDVQPTFTARPEGRAPRELRPTGFIARVVGYVLIATALALAFMFDRPGQIAAVALVIAYAAIARVLQARRVRIDATRLTVGKQTIAWEDVAHYTMTLGHRRLRDVGVILESVVDRARRADEPHRRVTAGTLVLVARDGRRVQLGAHYEDIVPALDHICSELITRADPARTDFGALSFDGVELGKRGGLLGGAVSVPVTAISNVQIGPPEPGDEPCIVVTTSRGDDFRVKLADVTHPLEMLVRFARADVALELSPDVYLPHVIVSSSELQRLAAVPARSS